MKNEKYLVIEKSILEKLIEDCKTFDKEIDCRSSSISKWNEGRFAAYCEIKDYCKPLDETI